MARSKLKFNRVGIISRTPSTSQKTNFRQEKLLASLRYVKQRLEQENISTFLLENSSVIPDLDLMIVLGGDGSVLNALAQRPYCPLLAINYGEVGFLTAAESADLESSLEKLLRGDYVISERLLLQCEYGSSQALVVNEVALRSSGKMLGLEVFVNQARIRNIRGDGVIVGTPTGSTAYLLSCGSPIVMPNAQCMVLCGINEYNFSSRPLILPASAVVNIKINRLLENQDACLSVNGRHQTNLREGDTITLKAALRPATLIFFDPDFFFNNLSTRLSWH